MGRRKGSINQAKLPEVFLLDEETRLQLIATLIVDILSAEINEEVA